MNNSDEQAQSTRQPGWAFLLWWTLATAIAGTLGLVLSDLLVLAHPIMQQPDIALSGDNGLGPLLLFGCGMILFVGSLIGLAQGWVLTSTTRFDSWVAWLIASAMGVPLALLATTVVALTCQGSAQALVWSTVPGVTFGYIQSLALRGYVQQPSWWVLSTGIAWLASLSAGLLAYLALSTQSVLYYPFYPFESALRWGISWTLGTFVLGVITGLSMIWLMRPPRQKSQPAESPGGS